MNPDSEEFRSRLEVKLQPDNIRATLGFAGLYQMTHELIKGAVVDEVREFYWQGFEDGASVYDEHSYSKQVLSKMPKNRFRASLLWLVESDAISLEQADKLEEIYAHRHALSHELIKYIVDPEFDPDIDLLIDALTILKDIRRFWTTVERDIGMFEKFGDLNLDDVAPLSLFVLQSCIDAYVIGISASD